MTTNQTIDGVLVSRELLEVFAGPRNYTPSQMRMAMHELRALLDAPAIQWLAMEVNGKPWVIKEGPNADKWRAMGYELLPVEPAAQPQAEPVELPRVLSLEDERCPRHPLIADGFRSGAYWYRREVEKLGPLYAEQPAPVAVVMPEFEPAFEKWWEEHGQYCRAGGGSYEKTFAYRAYEAALADVTRLNTK